MLPAPLGSAVGMGGFSMQFDPHSYLTRKPTSRPCCGLMRIGFEAEILSVLVAESNTDFERCYLALRAAAFS